MILYQCLTLHILLTFQLVSQAIESTEVIEEFEEMAEEPFHSIPSQSDMATQTLTYSYMKETQTDFRGIDKKTQTQAKYLKKSIATQTNSCLDCIKLKEEDSYDEMDDPTDETADRCFLVYESQLQFLLKHCPKCGGKIDVTETKEVATKGSLFVVSLVCVHGCVTKWKSQPPINSYIGVGNLDLTNAVALSGMYAF